MNKYIIPILLFAFAILFSYCNPSKKATSSKEKIVKKSTYQADMTALIMNNCTPCHIPPNGRKKPFDNYTNVKTDIDEIIRRIELNPTDKGFMPFKNKTKLSDSTISAFKKWRDDGLLEK